MKKLYKIVVIAKEADGGGLTEFENIQKLDKRKFITVFYLFRRVRNQNLRKYTKFFNTSYLDNRRFSLQNLFFFIKDIYISYKIILNEKPDLLFSLNLYSAATTILAKKIFFKTVPIICFINNDLLREISLKKTPLFRFLVFKLAKYIFNSADVLVFISDGLARAHQRGFRLKRSKSTVIYGALDKKLVKKLTKARLRQLEKVIKQDTYFKIFTVGRLEAQKDNVTILRSFKLLLGKVPNSKLFIIGDGALRKDLEEIVHQLNIPDKVYFLGWQQNVFPYLRFADLFVFSSHYEGFGYVIIEALALKIPVISTNTPYGPSEILGNGKYGIILPIGDYKRMSQKMKLLLMDKSLHKKYSKLAYQRSRSFELKNYLARYEDLFLRTIGKNRE